MDQASKARVLFEVQARNNGILIGGFNVDKAIVAIYEVLAEETVGEEHLTNDEILDRIDDCLAVMYAGIV